MIKIKIIWDFFAALARFELGTRKGRDLETILKTFESAIEDLRGLRDRHIENASNLDLGAEQKMDEALLKAREMRQKAESLIIEADRAHEIVGNLSKLIAK